MEKLTNKASKSAALALVLLTGCLGFVSQHALAADTSAFSEEPAPMNPEAFPDRPKPILELGSNFLGSGTLGQGFTIPTGATWQPALTVFGTFRTALQSFDNGSSQVDEWANRFDLFGNLQLSPTERFVIGFRPLDEDGSFTGKIFSHPNPAEEGKVSSWNGEVDRFFFEADFQELFPNIDKDDFRAYDYGFSVGRQPLFFQEGILINDSIDGIGIVRNSKRPKGTSNMRITGFWGWDAIHRGNNIEDESAQIFALFTQTDFFKTSVDADIVYVDADSGVNGGGSGLYAAIGAVQRFGKIGTALRVFTSHATDDETAAVSDGTLLFVEANYSPAYTHNNLYATGFYGIDRFTSAARGPSTGGPLGRAGILFAAVGIGSYGSPLDNRLNDTYGGALGYQMFFDGDRTQLTAELGVRIEDKGFNSFATGLRYRKALGQRYTLTVDGSRTFRETLSDGFGLRVEFSVQL